MTEFDPPLTWREWFLMVFRNEPERIFDAAERDEWIRKRRESKSAPREKPPARRRLKR